VYQALDLIPYKETLQQWDRVLIKVNFISAKTWDTGVTTDPIIVEALINRVRDLEKEVVVVETDAQVTNADKAVAKTGMKEMLDRVGVEFLNMRHSKEKEEIPVTDGKTLSSFKVARIATDSAIISAAKLKTLNLTTVTLGLKNMFGMLTTKWKAKYHAKGMSKVIHDICKELPPTLTVIDAFVGLRGSMPFRGKAVELNTIIASTDPVAADATASRIMGFEPKEIDHIRWANESGLGELDNIEVVGSELTRLIQEYESLIR
jgi:uncharacterized protein (DUF362 family)